MPINVYFHCPQYPRFEATQTRIICQGNQKNLILLCDQRVNHITSLGLNILPDKTRRLGSIVWLYDSVIIKSLLDDSKLFSDFHVGKPMPESTVALINKILSSLLLILCHLIL